MSDLWTDAYKVGQSVQVKNYTSLIWNNAIVTSIGKNYDGISYVAVKIVNNLMSATATCSEVIRPRLMSKTEAEQEITKITTPPTKKSYKTAEEMRKITDRVYQEELLDKAIQGTLDICERVSVSRSRCYSTQVSMGEAFMVDLIDQHNEDLLREFFYALHYLHYTITEDNFFFIISWE